MAKMINKDSGWFRWMGVLLIFLGIAAIALPMVASLAIESLFGWILLAGGLVKIIHSFRALNAGRCLLRLFGGVTYLFIGGMFLFYPLQGVFTLTLLLAILFVFDGIIKIMLSIRMRSLPNWGWMLMSGTAALILAGLIFSGYPGNVAWVLGLLVGINLVFSGWTMLMLSSAGVTVSAE